MSFSARSAVNPLLNTYIGEKEMRISVVRRGIQTLGESIALRRSGLMVPDGLTLVRGDELTRRQFLKLMRAVGALEATRPRKFISIPKFFKRIEPSSLLPLFPHLHTLVDSGGESYTTSVWVMVVSYPIPTTLDAYAANLRIKVVAEDPDLEA